MNEGTILYGPQGPMNQGNYWGNLRRAIFGLGGGKFRNQNSFFYPNTKRTVLIDVSFGSLMEVAMNVPHLNTVISTGAELFSLAEIKHVDKDGNDIENSPILKLLRKPNPLQTLSQYLYEFYVMNSVYNRTFQYKIKGLSYDVIPTCMWLLPSGQMKMNLTGKQYHQADLKGIIESFEMVSSDEKFEVENVIYMAEGIGNSILEPVSRIEALKIPLSNIVAAYKSFNIIVSERGMIGFLAPDSASTDESGGIPFDDKEAKRMREEYQRQYSLDGQGGHVALTTNNMKWVPMTFPVRDLMLFEGAEDAFAAICGAYRHDRDIYPSIKGATYENKAAGMKATIQNALQPLADKLCEQWNEDFIDPSTGEKIIASFKHVPAMQEDERLASQGKLYKAQTLEIGITNGIISPEQFADQMDWENDGTGIIIPKAPVSNRPPSNNN